MVLHRTAADGLYLLLLEVLCINDEWGSLCRAAVKITGFMPLVEIPAYMLCGVDFQQRFVCLDDTSRPKYRYI